MASPIVVVPTSVHSLAAADESVSVLAKGPIGSVRIELLDVLFELIVRRHMEVLAKEPIGSVRIERLMSSLS